MFLQSCWPLLGLLTSATAAPTAPGKLAERQINVPTGNLLSAYTPLAATCPANAQLLREANGQVSDAESSWVSARKPIADAALQKWLAKTGSFGRPRDYPVVALASSGGGLRATLISAGVHQAFDSRDSPNQMGGIFQALTYETALSGGAWLVGSLSGNNYPTVTDISKRLWYNTFSNSLLLPDSLLVAAPLTSILVDVTAKGLAGYGANLVDLYGRLLSYMLLEGPDGGVTTTMSAIREKDNFVNHQVPMPIVTAIGQELTNGTCVPPLSAFQYEMSPFEFGSFDAGVNGFMTSKYLGTTMQNGAPAAKGKCMTNFDNTGYAMGASSNAFSELCIPAPKGTSPDKFTQTLENLLNGLHGDFTRGVFATIPNPFVNVSASPGISHLGELTLTDGGATDQNNPIWPMLHRKVDVLFVSDSTSGPDNFPSGKEMHTTYVQDRAQGINRMPDIPDPSEIDASKPSFFGCGDASKLTIIYMPNRPYNYASGTPQAQVQYSQAQTAGMIKNGVASADYGGHAGWNVCVGCALMKKSGGSLPSTCGSCFSQYCVN